MQGTYSEGTNDRNTIHSVNSQKPKRNRSLSLRTQLFAKKLWNDNNNQASNTLPSIMVTNELESDTSNSKNDLDGEPNSPIELEDFGSQSRRNGIDEDNEVRPYAPQESLSVSTYSDQNGVGSRSTKSRSILTTNSTSDLLFESTSDNESMFSKKKESKLWNTLKDIKDKILGQKNLQPTGHGRYIPVSLEKTSSLNIQFGLDLYDEKIEQMIDERNGKQYCNNVITSSKYSVYSFLPQQIRAQLSKIANCYFIIIAIMQMIPSWSTTGKYTTIIPVCIFMSISIAREGYDDWKRHVNDKEENNKRTHLIQNNNASQDSDMHSTNTLLTETMSFDDPMDITQGSLAIDEGSVAEGSIFPSDSSHDLPCVSCRWKNVKVGDIIKVFEDEWFPADIVLLSSSEKNQEAYIETMALDGETNLKMKVPHREISKIYSNPERLKSNKILLNVEDPNKDLYNFESSFVCEGAKYALNNDNIVYRGSVLRNTTSVIGVVVFTGEETKIRMNNIRNPRTKSPKLQKNINYIVIFMVVVVMSLSAFSTMAEIIQFNSSKSKMWYLLDQNVGVAATFMGFIIMYNTLIPLSLYVTMEIIKVMQLLLLQFDIDMYDVKSNTPAEAKTATILEELGQVSYIFSDKTGTLTDNIMVFRKLSIGGISWIHEPDLLLQSAKEFGDISNHRSELQLLHSNSEMTSNRRGKPHSFTYDSESDNDLINRKAKSMDVKFNSSNRHSTTSIIRSSIDFKPLRSLSTIASWKSTAHPMKIQNSKSSVFLLKYIFSNPNTLFAKKAKFFFLSIALCNTCLPKRKNTKESAEAGAKISADSCEDEVIQYSSSSPDELALVEAARDLGFVVYDRKDNAIYLKTYPKGFENDPLVEKYSVLEVIEFSSTRKRMSILVKFPDGKICLLCKGADNVILERLSKSDVARSKQERIALNTMERKQEEADYVIQSRLSQEMDENIKNRKSIDSVKGLFDSNGNTRISKIMNSIDKYLMGQEENEIDEIVTRSKNSLHLQQAVKFSMDEVASDSSSKGASLVGPDTQYDTFPDDRLLINDEYIIEKTIEHIEEFSTEGLRTLVYSYRWIKEDEFNIWSKDYSEAKTSLNDRQNRVESVGSRIETSLQLIGATAIEDKLQEGVCETLDKLRRAGIKMWMLTGDKRETAINIGYSCSLIKDFSTLVVLKIENGKEKILETIKQTAKSISTGGVAHCVFVIDGATLSAIEDDKSIMPSFIELCTLVDSAICCRVSPSQKANMVLQVRNVKKSAVTLAIGDGANDIAMIQSADIGVGITGKEGLQAARSADYSIAQFRFLLKLLLVNGRYNYVRTSKFVLCTFYKELVFYLSQAIYQRQNMFSGSSFYESWSLSMFNTLFTSLTVLCIGMFDKDLKPATLLAVPELYEKGRLYQAFNLKVFVGWMILATLQSLVISFLSCYLWGLTSLTDNSVLPIGTLSFTSLIILINVKCNFIEMQNRHWVVFAAFFISVCGWGIWNVLIMFLYRSKSNETIFFVDYGLMHFGKDQTWWAALFVCFSIPILFDILIKVFKFVFFPSNDEIFRLFEKDIEMRRFFEIEAYKELSQGWTFPRDSSIWKTYSAKIWKKMLNSIRKSNSNSDTENAIAISLSKDDYLISSTRSRSNTARESPSNTFNRSRSNTANRSRSNTTNSLNIIEDRQIGSDYDILPSGKLVKLHKGKNLWSKMGSKIANRPITDANDDVIDDDADAIIEARLNDLRNTD